MEENVALDSKKQRKFDKSIKGIKKLLKKDADKPHKPAVLAPKDTESEGAKSKRWRKEKGLVYLSHIPHGFYEHEMTQYFKQFGTVTNVRVIRSPRTGRSKGYAFVEFREPEVAEIVAETMNNYLMGKRLIKAAIIPLEKQRHRAFRKHWTSKHNPTADRRVQERKSYNADWTDGEHLKKARKMLSTLQKTKKKLSDLGIDYDFFTPVDVPEPLLEQVEIKSESDNKVKDEPLEKRKKNKKTKAVDTNETETNDKKPETIQPNPNNAKNKKEAKKAQESDKMKQKRTQDAGMKLAENFIEVGGESGEESDSSLDFDSDEYEKMMENDSDASSGDESEDDEGEGSDDDNDEDQDGSDDDNDESDDEVSEEELPKLIPIKEKKGKKPIIASPPQPKVAKIAKVQKVQKVPPPQAKKAPKAANIPKAQKGPLPPPQAMKRKNIQSVESPKKPKFEKKVNKQRNKQFKKKNKA